MSASVGRQTIELARAVAARSALSRRRAEALVRLAIAQFKALHVLLALLMVVGMAIVIGTERVRETALPVHNRAMPLTSPTPASNLDRFHVLHYVQHGNTIWGLAQYYYGSSAAADLQRILRVNPEVVHDPRLMTVDTPIKVPLP